MQAVVLVIRVAGYPCRPVCCALLFQPNTNTPISCAPHLHCTASSPSLHAGKYVLLYDGQGKIILDGDATVTWQAPGRIGLTLAPANGFAVRIVDTDTSNPVRNISVVPAAKELTFTTDVYQPGFLALVNGVWQALLPPAQLGAPMVHRCRTCCSHARKKAAAQHITSHAVLHSTPAPVIMPQVQNRVRLLPCLCAPWCIPAGLKVLRFSNWQRVWGDANNPQVVPRSWDDRSTLSTHSYLRKDGVSVEHMVALANKVGAPSTHEGWES